MKSIKITVLACRWETITGSYPIAPWPITLLTEIFSESPSVEQDGGWSLADFWVKSTLGQLRFQGANVIDLGILTGSVQGSDRGTVKNLAVNQAIRRGIRLPANDPVIIFIDPPPSDAGALLNQNYAVLDRGAEHTYMAHELGHTLGYQHSLGIKFSTNTVEQYYDPYCIMSARIFAEKAPYSRVPPAGVALPPNLPAYFWSISGVCGSGPLAAAAQTFISVPDFSAGPNVFSIPSSSLATGTTQTILLKALSVASFNDIVLIKIDTLVGRYFVEYRTAVGWDKGLSNNNPSPGIIIHKAASSLSCEYLDTIPVPLTGSDNWIEPNNDFRIRLISVDIINGIANIEVSPKWGNYKLLGREKVAGSPSVVSIRNNRIDIFVRGTDNALYTKSWEGTRRSNYIQLGGEHIVGAPALVSWGTERIDVFVKGTDNALYTKFWDGTNWSSYAQLGGEHIADTPSAVSSGTNRIDVFVRGTDNALYTKYWDGAQWSNYTQLGGEHIVGAPAVVSWGTERIDVFVRGTDGALYTKFWNGIRWSSYTQLGGEHIADTPTAISWGPNRIDVFVKGTDNALYTKSWDGTQWSGYTQLGGEHITDTPSIVSRVPNHIDIFVRGTDNALYTKSWNGTQWSNYTQLGSEHIVGTPAVVSCAFNRIDVFVQGTDGALYTKNAIYD